MLFELCRPKFSENLEVSKCPTKSRTNLTTQENRTSKLMINLIGQAELNSSGLHYTFSCVKNLSKGPNITIILVSPEFFVDLEFDPSTDISSSQTILQSMTSRLRRNNVTRVIFADIDIHIRPNQFSMFRKKKDQQSSGQVLKIEFPCANFQLSRILSYFLF